MTDLTDLTDLFKIQIMSPTSLKDDRRRTRLSVLRQGVGSKPLSIPNSCLTSF